MGFKGIKAFVDNYHNDEFSFCHKYLSSPEFTLPLLTSLCQSSITIKNPKKEDIALVVARLLEQGSLKPEEVLLAYVKRPRTWLTFKQGQYTRTPVLNSPTLLLKSFGEEGWYGPIKESISRSTWYIRTCKIENYRDTNADETDETVSQKSRIRWPIVAEVAPNYVALSWEGFTYNTQDRAKTRVQFPFWTYIPEVFDELANHLQAQWEYPDFHKFVLHDLWSKYINDEVYSWRHMHIRAEASGIALNARSSGITEIDLDVRGLKALSRELAEASLEALGFKNDQQKLKLVEDVLLHTLIREWGTLSYEFSLDKFIRINSADSGKLNTKHLEKLVRTHCYFGLKNLSKGQDSLPHFRCYSDYSKSRGTLNFLLAELGL